MVNIGKTTRIRVYQLEPVDSDFSWSKISILGILELSLIGLIYFITQGILTGCYHPCCEIAPILYFFIVPLLVEFLVLWFQGWLFIYVQTRYQVDLFQILFCK
jgi:hypothetical protein